MSRPATRIRPLVAHLVAEQELEEGRLPGARRPDEEDELALGDVEGDVAEGDDVALVDLGDVLEANHESPMNGTRRTRRQSRRVSSARLTSRRHHAARSRCAPPLEVRLDERVEVAVEHGLHVAGLVAGPLVLHELVRRAACRCGSGSRTRRRACRPTAPRAPCARSSRCRSASRAARICIAFALFCVCERSFWHDTTTPVGRCVMRTAESVTFTC